MQDTLVAVFESGKVKWANAKKGTKQKYATKTDSKLMAKIHQ